MTESAAPRVRSNPYVGLRPFMREDSQLFFGRREQINALLALLQQSRFLPVVGSSGSGKSSLVRAGLVPALCSGFLVQDRDQWSIATMKPGDAPFYNLALALRETAVPAAANGGGTDHAAVAALAEAIAADPFDAVSGAISEQVGERKNLLLVVDQFEEIFAFRAEPGGEHDSAAGASDRGRDWSERRAEADELVALLLELADDRSLPVYVVLTMRSDFAGDCDLFRGLPEAMNRTRYLVPRLRREQLRQAIEGPALLGGVALAPRLLDRVLNEMGDRSDQLPILQHALQRTWEQGRGQSAANGEQRPAPSLEQTHYEAAGTLANALRMHADEALAVVDRKLAALLFQRLTDTDLQGRRVRRATSYGDLRELAEANGFTEPQVAQALAEFQADGRHFVHVADAASRDARRVDISHESLIRQWPALRDWVDQERSARDQFRELLAHHARHDQAGRTPATLLQEADLAVAEQWFAQANTGAVWARRYAAAGAYEAVVAYVQRSKQAKVHAARARRRTVIAVGLLLALATVVTTTMWLDALDARKAADLDRGKAQKESLRASQLLATNLQQQGRDALQAGDPRTAASALAAAYQLASEDPVNRLLLPHALALGVGLDVAVLSSTAGKPVNSARFSPDGTRAVTASDDGTARLWVVPSGRAIATLTGHTDLVTDAVFDPAGDRILTASADGTVRSWDGRTGQAREVLLRDQRSILNIVFRGADTLVLTVDGEDSGAAVRVWTLADRPSSVTLKGHVGAPSSAELSADGSRVATVDQDGAVRAWDAQSGERLRELFPPRWSRYERATFTSRPMMLVTLEAFSLGRDASESRPGTVRVWGVANGVELFSLSGHTDAVNSVAVSSDHGLWLTASSDHTARVWDRTGNPIALLVGHEDQVVAARFSPDGERVVTVGRDESARLWYARTGHLIAELTGHADAVTDATFSADGSYLLTVSNDGSTRLWNTRGSRAAAILKGHDGPVRSASFNPDGTLVVTAGLDATARVWDARSGAQRSLLRHDGVVYAASFSQDGHRIVTAGADNSAVIWDAQSGKQLVSLAHRSAVKAASFSPDGSKVVTVMGDGDNPAIVWDASSGKELYRIEPGSPVQAASFSPNGKLLLIRSDNKVSVWNALTGAALARGLGEEVDVAVFSPDSQSIVTGGYEATTFWDAPAWKERPAHDDGPVTALAFNPKGTRLLVAKGGWARMLDPRSAAHLFELKGHRQPIRSMCFSQDGAWVATASEDLTTRVWDAQTGRVLLTFEGHQGPISALACSADGTRLLTASDDGTARLWDTALESRPPAQIMKLVQKLPDAMQTAVPASN